MAGQSFEQWLWDRCRERRVSLRELAEACGLSATYWVVRLHRQRRGLVEEPPPARALVCAARYLGLPLSTMLVTAGALTEEDIRTLPTAGAGPLDLEALDEEGQAKLLEYYAMLRRLYGRDRQDWQDRLDRQQAGAPAPRPAAPRVPPPPPGRQPRPRRARGFAQRQAPR